MPTPTPDEILALETAATAEIGRATEAAAVEEVLAANVRRGRLGEILRSLSSLPAEVRGEIGRAANGARVRLEAAAAARREALRAAAEGALAETEWVDPTLPWAPHRGGVLHPTTQMIRRLEDVFLGMGFQLLDGPWVEDDHHNFGALNIPADHPARDAHDTFWLADGHLLRTHTSTMQIRAMESGAPPIRAAAIGRVFRHEEVDATHESTFHQVEGFLVDRDVSVAHMVSVLRDLLGAVLGTAVEVRLRPAYFPFVEPGFEMDVAFRGRWLELLGCGLVHPNVLRAGRVDPAHFSGFAFGMGVDRLVLLKHGIEDIRHLLGGDLAFLRQFRRGVEA